jgi:hypothetical protein
MIDEEIRENSMLVVGCSKDLGRCRYRVDKDCIMRPYLFCGEFYRYLLEVLDKKKPPEGGFLNCILVYN